VTEELGERLEGLHRDLVEATLAIVESRGSEDVEVRVKDEVVAEGLDPGDGGELAVGEVKAGPEPVAQALDGGAEEKVEQMTAFAEDAV